jgi:hypothetical protein
VHRMLAPPSRGSKTRANSYMASNFAQRCTAHINASGMTVTHSSAPATAPAQQPRLVSSRKFVSDCRSCLVVTVW